MNELNLDTLEISVLPTTRQGRVIVSVCVLLFVLQFASIFTLSYLQYLGWDLSVWDFGFYAQALHLIGQGQMGPYSSYEQIPFLR
ncbi:MAG: hypothetical protein JWN30_670, partial [Bacilli bacterium]|nr:hypothetical protein [Bacilli bacterium]